MAGSPDPERILERVLSRLDEEVRRRLWGDAAGVRARILDATGTSPGTMLRRPSLDILEEEHYAEAGGLLLTTLLELNERGDLEHRHRITAQLQRYRSHLQETYPDHTRTEKECDNNAERPMYNQQEDLPPVKAEMTTAFIECSDKKTAGKIEQQFQDDFNAMVVHVSDDLLANVEAKLADPAGPTVAELERQLYCLAVSTMPSADVALAEREALDPEHQYNGFDGDAFDRAASLGAKHTERLVCRYLGGSGDDDDE